MNRSNICNTIGAVIGGINQRKGTIIASEVQDEEFTMTAEVSLNDMFGCTPFFLRSASRSCFQELTTSTPQMLRSFVDRLRVKLLSV